MFNIFKKYLKPSPKTKEKNRIWNKKHKLLSNVESATNELFLMDELGSSGQKINPNLPKTESEHSYIISFEQTSAKNKFSNFFNDNNPLSSESIM